MRYHIAFLIALSTVCWADDAVTLTLTGAGNNTWTDDYTYPYYLSIDGNAPVAMMCDAFTREMSLGEVWEANAVTPTATNENSDLFFSSSTEFANTNSPVTAYNEGAYIFTGVTEGTIGAVDGNVAMWELFDPALSGSVTGATADSVNGILSDALSHASDTYLGIAVYTPLQSDSGTPQEFFAAAGVTFAEEGTPQAPEPSSSLLLATGGALLAAIGARRKGAVRS